MRLPSLPRLFKRKASDTYLAVDLGSTTIKVALFKPASELAQAKVLAEGAQVQGLSSMYGGRVLDLDAVLESFNLAIEAVSLKSGAMSHQVVLGLSGGILFSRSFKVRVKRAKSDQQLDDKEYALLAKQIEEKTLDQATSELSVKHGVDFTRVETRFTSIWMDGAKVVTPLGITGSEVEVAVLHYFIESKRLGVINSLVDQLGLEIVSLVDSSVTLAVDQAEQYGDYVLLDVGGSVTTVVIVIGGRVMGVDNLFIGGRDFTERIQHDLELTYDVAENLKLNYSQGQLDHERGRQIKHCVEAVAEQLVEGVAVMLGALVTKDLPANIVVAGEGRHLAEVRSALASFPWTKSVNFVGFPKIEVLQGKYPSIAALTRVEI